MGETPTWPRNCRPATDSHSRAPCCRSARCGSNRPHPRRTHLRQTYAHAQINPWATSLATPAYRWRRLALCNAPLL
eukprot:11154523-Lingulodinium_polyedra.AAC.1